MPSNVLIIGEHPDEIDFDAPDAPEGVTPQSIRAGLEGSRDRLNAAGHDAHILYTTGLDAIESEARAALRERRYDVIVIGAGLRTLPPFAVHFERLMNVVHAEARQAKLAFNGAPDDSDEAALRVIEVR